jgi:hypothetical protein
MTRPARFARTPLLLAAGHVGVGVAAVAFCALLLAGDLTRSPEQPATLDGLFIGAVSVLAAIQVVSIHRLARQRSAFIQGRLDAPTLCAGMRRVPWTAMGAHLPLLVGANAVVLSAPPAPLLALLCSAICASLLLDIAHGGWAYKHVCGRGPQVRALPPGGGARVRDAQVVVRAALVMLAAVGLVLGSRPVTHLADAAAGPLPVRLLGLGSALAVIVLPLLLIRPVTAARRAIYAVDTVHRPTLDTAARTLRRVGVLGMVPAGLVVTAVLSTPGGSTAGVSTAGVVLLAAAPIIPLALTLGTAAQQLASYTCINLADPQTLTRRRAGARPASTRS